MRAKNFRGYVNKESRAVMIRHNSLECWIVNFVNKSNKVSKRRKSQWAFTDTKVSAITTIRRRNIKLPQSGWERVSLRDKDGKTWDDLVLRFWNH